MKPALEILSNDFAVCRLDSSLKYSTEFSDQFLSITRTTDELSVVCEESKTPAESQSEPGWKCLKVRGPLDFGLIGILAGISSVLADAGISIFAISTFDTDYILVKKASLNKAVKSLTGAGYQIIHLGDDI